MAAPFEKLEDSWYIGGAVGQSQLQPDGGDDWALDEDKDLAKKVYGGFNIGRDFGLEAFWNDFGAASVKNKKSNTKADVAYRAYGANLVYHVPSYLGAIHPIVKLGVAKVDTKGDGVAVNQKNKFDVMGGVGAEYELAEGFRVRAEYERFDEDIEQFSIGLNWRPVLTRPKPVVVPKVVEPPKPVRPIVIVNQTPPPKPVKVAPPPKPVIKTVVKHVPVIVNTPAPKTIVKHVPAPAPVVHRVVVNNPPKPQPKVIHKTLAGGSHFASNSASLTRSGQNALNRMAQDLLRDQVIIHNITIVGHTDSVGSHAANQRLSQQRASAVAGYLASRGLNRGLMTVLGRGESEPVASNASPAGRAKNRRVNLVVKGSQTVMK